MEDKKLCLCFKALNDETRLNIVKMLKNNSMCACKILESFDITQPTLSYHMKLLIECELVNAEKVGKWYHYSINNHTIDELKKFFDEI